MNLRQDVFDSVETYDRPSSTCHSSPVRSPCSEDVSGSSTDQILPSTSSSSGGMDKNGENDPSKPIRDTYLNHAIEIHNTGDVGE